MRPRFPFAIFLDLNQIEGAGRGQILLLFGKLLCGVTCLVLSLRPSVILDGL